MAGKGTQRRRYTAEFMLRMARDAIRDVETISAVAARHDVHPNQVRDWRRQYDEAGQCAFRNGAKREADQAAITKDLHAKIGDAMFVSKRGRSDFDPRRDRPREVSHCTCPPRAS